jgi:hypothetical protein
VRFIEAALYGATGDLHFRWVCVGRDADEIAGDDDRSAERQT